MFCVGPDKRKAHTSGFTIFPLNIFFDSNLFDNNIWIVFKYKNFENCFIFNY